MDQAVEFGRYVLERRLAIGGMAEIFLGSVKGPVGFSRKLVIKRILPEFVDNASYERMFMDEARLAARFNHPNLVQVYDLCKVNGQYAIVMEYIEGRDLKSIIQTAADVTGPLPVDLCVFMVAEVAEGLHYAHELCDDEGQPLRVVHRDMTPSNVIVTRFGTVKVVDFGIAKQERGEERTGLGVIKGNVAYMSPEQANALPLDRRSDIFSLGTLLYELLTLRPCFYQENLQQTLLNVTAARYDGPRAYRTEVPGPLIGILDRMLARRPADRFQTAAELGRALREYLAARPHAPSTQDLRQLLNMLGEDDTAGKPRPYTAVFDEFAVVVSAELADPRSVISEAHRRLLVGSTEQDWDVIEDFGPAAANDPFASTEAGDFSAYGQVPTAVEGPPTIQLSADELAATTEPKVDVEFGVRITEVEKPLAPLLVEGDTVADPEPGLSDPDTLVAPLKSAIAASQQSAETTIPVVPPGGRDGAAAPGEDPLEEISQAFLDKTKLVAELQKGYHGVQDAPPKPQPYSPRRLEPRDRGPKKGGTAQGRPWLFYLAVGVAAGGVALLLAMLLYG